MGKLVAQIGGGLLLLGLVVMGGIGSRASGASGPGKPAALPQQSPRAEGAASGAAALGLPPASSSWEGVVQEAQRRQSYTNLLAGKDYDALEELAGKLRSERAHSDPMHWEIDNLYDGLTEDPREQPSVRLERIKSWAQARPASLTARVALAEALYNAAWDRRGPGFADTVSPEGWSEFRRLESEAEDVLDSLAAKTEADTRYWILRVRLGGENNGDVRDIVRQAAAKGQRDPVFFREAARFFQPRWGGSGGAFRDFAEQAAALTRDVYGEGMYSWLAWQAMRDARPREFAEDFAFDWKRMRKGFEDIIRLAPDCPRSYHRYARVAWDFDDRLVARALFRRPELGWFEGAERGIWDESNKYDQAREWALRTPVEPFLESPPPTVVASSWKDAQVQARAGDFKSWPQIVLQGELVSGGTVARPNAFLVRTGSVTFVVSAVPWDPKRNDDMNGVREAWRRATSWRVWPPVAPAKPLRVRAIATVSPANYQLGVALDVTPAARSHPSVHVLRPSTTNVDLFSRHRFFLVGCQRVQERCQQFVVEGALAAAGGSEPTMNIALDRSYDEDAFVGSPVLDEDGYVIAVASGPHGMRMPPPKQGIAADLLSSVLPSSGGAGATAPPPQTAATMPATAPAARSPTAAPPVPASAAARGLPLAAAPATSLIDTPYARWPPIVLQNEIVLPSGRLRTGSFLLSLPSGVVAVTALNDRPPGVTEGAAARETWMRSTGWTMWSPAKPRAVLQVAGLVPRRLEPWQRAAGFALAPVRGSLPVTPLSWQGHGELTGPCYVVGCVWDGTTCRQSVVEGRIAGYGKNLAGVVNGFSIGLQTEIGADDYLGGAVLDASGAVVGAITGRSRSWGSEYKAMRDAETIEVIVPDLPH
jgi:hypothetical protein